MLRLHQREIARYIHLQMQDHYWEDSIDYEARISRGFTDLKETAFTTREDPPFDYRYSPPDKTNMAQYLFGGFAKCLYPEQKFHSDSERKLAVILERESLKWFRPAKGQFQIFYRLKADHCEYQPDFVAEMEACICMIEAKERGEMESQEVLAKKDAAVTWCRNASDYARTYNGKAWAYLLVPHDVIADNMTLDVLSKLFVCK